MGEVVVLTDTAPPTAESVIDVLRECLERAESGEVVGVVVAMSLRGGDASHMIACEANQLALLAASQICTSQMVARVLGD